MRDSAKYNRDRRKKYPWIYILYEIRKRCNNSNYKRYNDYGGRGIQCLITSEELKELWFRDKAWLLKKPSIDREDNDGHYELGNCQFIEHDENSVKDKRKPILQYDLNNIFIAEHISIQQASRKTDIHASEICEVAKLPNRNSAGGFIWRYK